MSITLPPPPDEFLMHPTQGECYTANQLRARDIEVARLVLKAAADLVDGNAAYCSGQTAAILGSNADAIRALEVKHG